MKLKINCLLMIIALVLTSSDARDYSVDRIAVVDETIKTNYYSSIRNALVGTFIFGNRQKAILNMMKKAYNNGKENEFNQAVKEIMQARLFNLDDRLAAKNVLFESTLIDAYSIFSVEQLKKLTDNITKIPNESNELPQPEAFKNYFAQYQNYQKIVTDLAKADSITKLNAVAKNVKEFGLLGNRAFFDIFRNRITQQYLQGTDANRVLYQKFFANNSDSNIKEIGYNALRQYYAMQKNAEIEGVFKAFKEDTYLESIENRPSEAETLLTSILKKAPKTPADYAIQANAFLRLFDKVTNPKDFQRLSLKRIQQIAQYLAQKDENMCEQLKFELKMVLNNKQPVDKGLNNALENAFTRGANKGYRKVGKRSPITERESGVRLVLNEKDYKPVGEDPFALILDPGTGDQAIVPRDTVKPATRQDLKTAVSKLPVNSSDQTQKQRQQREEEARKLEEEKELEAQRAAELEALKNQGSDSGRAMRD